MTAPNDWPPKAREAVANALREAGVLSIWEMTTAPEAAGTILAALAPFVAAREAAAFQRGAEAARAQDARWLSERPMYLGASLLIAALPIPEDKP